MTGAATVPDRRARILVALTAAEVASALVESVNLIAGLTDGHGLIVVYGEGTPQRGGPKPATFVTALAAAAPRHLLVLVGADPATGQIPPTKRDAFLDLLDTGMIAVVAVSARSVAASVAAVSRQVNIGRVLRLRRNRDRGLHLSSAWSRHQA